MRVLHVDEKWSVEYDEANNDRPVRLLRHGEPASRSLDLLRYNAVVALFYALLKAKEPNQ